LLLGRAILVIAVPSETSRGLKGARDLPDALAKARGSDRDRAAGRVPSGAQGGFPLEVPSRAPRR